MPDVIADTSALQYLHQARRLDLLRVLYGTILVPVGVVEELGDGLAAGHDLPEVAALDWILVTPIRERQVRFMTMDLGKGERDVLSLASERSEATAILDDALARKVARELGIRFTGTLGVLLRAKAAGHLDAVEPVVDELQALEAIPKPGHGRAPGAWGSDPRREEEAMRCHR